jgi:hypothetical protein
MDILLVSIPEKNLEIRGWIIMTKKIRLMADYGCDPLWGEEPDEIGDLDPTTLPISQETLKRLEKWVHTYEAILNWEDPASSGFPSVEAREDFDKEGISLWLQLRKELSPDYEVLYFSEILQKNINHPSELAEFYQIENNFSQNTETLKHLLLLGGASKGDA